MTPSQLKFSSLEELENFLPQHQIDSALWKGGRVQTLYNEIKTGECVLEIKDAQLYRKINVVSVHCFHTNSNQEKFKLYEDHQILSKGEIRKRDYDFVSETMKPYETPHQAAKRALEEELQISDAELQFEATPDLDENKTKISTTYVGIPTNYRVYHFRTTIPERLFKETYVEKEEEVETHFCWIKA